MRYLNAAEGDAHSALRIAVADLLDLSEEAEYRKQALDRWTSLGYVRGRASSILAMQAARVFSEEVVPLHRRPCVDDKDGG